MVEARCGRRHGGWHLGKSHGGLAGRALHKYTGLVLWLRIYLYRPAELCSHGLVLAVLCRSVTAVKEGSSGCCLCVLSMPVEPVERKALYFQY